MFAIPVKRIYHNTEDNETRQAIAKAIESIYKYSRIDSENIKRGTAYFASCEICTVWYLAKNNNSLYGFDSQYKLKCKTYTPMQGVELYPLIDELDDMKAMSFQYDTTVDDDTITFFETYTDNRHLLWRSGHGATSWTLVKDEQIKLMKIPAIYANRRVPIFDGLSYIREEIEYTLSRNSDVIAYNSAPIICASGLISGGEEKGEGRRVYMTETGGSVSYVSWQQSIEALKYHVSTLLNLFWSQSQMPDVSFESMKGLGNIGYDARQTLLTDAHLKVGDESGAWLEFFDRETNVIKAYLKEMRKDWADEIDNVEVEHVISPFIQNDEKAEIDKWVSACGGKAVVSQLDAIKNAGISSDPRETLRQIQEEDGYSVENRMEDLFTGAR
jgi:hypothetical protein